MKLDIVGTAEAAEMIGVSQNTINVWRLRGQFPEPDAVLVCGLVWRRSTIARWMKGAGAERVARARAAA